MAMRKPWVLVNALERQPKSSIEGGPPVRHREGVVVHKENRIASFDLIQVSTILSQSMGLSPIPLDDSRTTFLGNPLVNGSAKLFSDLT